MGQLIPFTAGAPAEVGLEPLILVAADRGRSRLEVGSLSELHAVLERGIAAADVQLDCTEAGPAEIATAAACGVRRFAIDSGTDLEAIPRRAGVLVRVAATGSPVWRALLAGLNVEGMIVERADLTRAADVWIRLALEGLPMRALQVDAPLSGEERRTVAAMFAGDPDLWIAVETPEDQAAAPEEHTWAVRELRRDA